LTRRCIETIQEKTSYKNYEILVIDNESQKTGELTAYYQEIQKAPNIRVSEYNQPFNFAALNNYAAGLAKGDLVLFLNNDMEVISAEWLEAMVEHAQRKEVGAVGAKLLYPDGSIQHCGVIIGLGTIAAHAFYRCPDDRRHSNMVDIIRNYSAVTAACMMVRKDVFKELGGFDENLAVDYNDIDFCLKLREKGYLIVYTPYARLYHLESFTRGYADKPEKRTRRLQEIEYVKARWGAVIAKGDPYYNPNLSLTRLDFSIDPQPRRNS
jgi:O-antigen biosynthesis protein